MYTEFGTRAFPDPCKNVFNRIFSQIVPSDLTDNGCINVYKLSNEYYASSETCNIWRVCQKTLNVKKKVWRQRFDVNVKNDYYDHHT